MRRDLFLVFALVFVFGNVMAVDFTPYIPDDDEIAIVPGGVHTKYWLDEDGNEMDLENPPSEDWYCTYCADVLEYGFDPRDGSDYMKCLDEVFEQGVVLSEDGERYVFIGCGDPDCPMHHVQGWGVDPETGEPSAGDQNPPIRGDQEKPRLPIGDTWTLVFFGLGYAALRRKMKKA